MRVAQVLWAAPGGGDATFPGTARAGLARRAAVVALSAACAFAIASPASAQQANGASSEVGEAPQAPASSRDEAQLAPAPPPPPSPYPYPYPYPYPPPGPSGGSSDEDYKEQIRSTKQQIKVAEHNGDEAEEERLKEELDQLKKEYAKYQKENYVRKNGGMMGGGIALASMGGLGLIVGSLLMLGNDNDRMTGYVLMGVGIASIGAGIPLAIVGGRRVPRDSIQAGSSPILIVSPRGAALHVTF